MRRFISKAQRKLQSIAGDARTLSKLAGRSYDVAFFSGAPIDEVWIRTTYRECVRRGLRCINLTTATRHAADAVSALPATLRLLRLLRARAIVTASSGLPSWAKPIGCRYSIHMPHSLVSLQMVYPEDAFDGYNVLFACGDHHLAEIAAIDRSRGIRGRSVYRIGYGRSDILAEMPVARGSASPTVLIAPSWGAENVLESFGRELIGALLAAGRRVILRPHPVICHERPALVTELRRTFSSVSEFEFEAPGSSDRSLAEADIMISDFSGIGMEFAFTRNRPVVYVDVPRKVRNPNYLALGLTPLEIEIRPRLGAVVPPVLEAICAQVDELLANPTDPSAIADLRQRYAYHWGTTGKAAADEIQRMLT